MKKIFLTIGVGFLCISVSFAQAPFSGMLKMKTENKAAGETATVDCYIKGGNAYMQFNTVSKEVSMQYTLYFLNGQGTVKMTTEGGGKQVYLEIPLSSFSNTEFSTAFSVEETGKKENISGYNCREVIVRTSNSNISCLVSDETGLTSASLPSILQGRGVFAALLRNGIRSFPVRIIATDFSGNIIFSQELTEVKAGEVGDDRFVVPAGYVKAN